MKAQGTSYSNGQPKDLEGFVDQEIRKAAISNMARDFGWDEDITNAVVRGEWARQDQKNADHNTRKEAARTVATQVAAIIATVASKGTLGPKMLGVMKGLGAGSAKIGAHVVKTAIQVIDGSRNGTEGMLAGLGNGVLGTMTAAKFDFGEMISPSLAGAGLGLGISYDVKRDPFGNKKPNWGGMLGIGGNNTNLSVSFSERGATTISGSYGLDENINLTSSYNTGSGVTNVGATFRFDEGSDYENFRLGAGYNFHTRPAGDSYPLFPNERERTGFSGSVTYTPFSHEEGAPWDPSMTVGFNPNGLNSSLSTNGVNLGSVNNNGFQAGSQNWVQENISAAQSNAGSGGDQWLEGIVGDGIDYVYDNILSPIGNGIVDIGNYIVDGFKAIPQKLADLFLPEIPLPGLSFDLNSLLSGGSIFGGNQFLSQEGSGSLFDLLSWDSSPNQGLVNNLEDDYEDAGEYRNDEALARKKLLESLLKNGCKNSPVCDQLGLSNKTADALIKMAKYGMLESDLNDLNKTLVKEAIQAEIKNSVNDFVAKNQTYDAALEKMNELLNSGNLSESEKQVIGQNISILNREKTISMNQFNQSIASLSDYQNNLESRRHYDYTSQSLESFPHLSDELRSLALFMKQGHRIREVSNLTNNANHADVIKRSKQNLNYYIQARQERIERDKSPHNFTYPVQIGGNTHVFSSIENANPIFQQLEEEFGK